MPGSPTHMRNTDAFTWRMERDPCLRSTIVTIVRLDRAPDPARLTTRARRLTRELPMFRQRIVETPLHLATPRWVVDEDFDLSWHLRWESLASWDDVMDAARRDAMTAFDPAHPLWKATIVEGLPDGQAAAVLKLHHSLTDGIGGMEMGLLLFDQERDAREPEMPEPPDAEWLSDLDLVREAVVDDLRQVLHTAGRAVIRSVPATLGALRAPRHTVTRAAGLVASVARTVRPISNPGSAVLTDRHVGRHLAVIDASLADLRRAAAVADGTLNDAFMTGVTGGVRRYHERHGAPTDRLWVTLPINVRTPEDPLGGNRITLQRFELRAGDPDVVARMHDVHEACWQARLEPAVPYTDTIAASLNLLPSGVLGSMLKHVDILASDVPGFPFTVYLAGAEVLAYHAFGPTIGAALNVTLLSYRDTCSIGVTIDTAAAPDPEVLVECLREGFDEVLAARPRRQPRSRKAAPEEMRGTGDRRTPPPPAGRTVLSGASPVGSAPTTARSTTARRTRAPSDATAATAPAS